MHCTRVSLLERALSGMRVLRRARETFFLQPAASEHQHTGLNPDFVRRAANLLHFGLATFLTAASTATYADNKAPTPQCLDTPRTNLQVISGKNIEVRVDELGHPSVISFIPVGLVRANRRSEFLVRGAFNSQSETVA